MCVCVCVCVFCDFYFKSDNPHEKDQFCTVLVTKVNSGIQLYAKMTSDQNDAELT
jgi:hypothetical protein